MRWGLALAATAGCGRIAFDPIAGAPGDAPTAACEQAWLTSPNVTTPLPVSAANTSAIDYAPHLDPNGLDLYFASTRNAGAHDIFVSSRPTVDGTFGPPTISPDLNTTTMEDLAIAISIDRREAFRSSGIAFQQLDLWRATRVDTSAPFTSFAVIAEIASPADELNPYLTVNGRELYFAARDGVMGVTDLWVAQRADVDSPFDPPRIIPELDTTFEEASPSLIATGRVIVFASTRPGTIGSLSLWYATRASTSDAFGTPQLVPNVNFGGRDYTPYLRPDGCELFFSSSRVGDQEDVYVSQILP